MTIGSIGTNTQTYGLQNGTVSGIHNEALEDPRVNDHDGDDANKMSVSVLRDPALGNKVDITA
jgi:hypothetical protein